MNVLSYTTVDFSHTSEKFTNPYRFGFNGMERDDETYGKGNALDFGARIYDSRLGRWLSVDPLQQKYPNTGLYAAMGSNPLYFIDCDGRYIIPTNLFLKSHLGEVVQKMLYHKENITFVSKYLNKYMGTDQDLRLGVTEDYPPQLDGSSLEVTGGVYLGKTGKTSYVNVNKFAHLIMTTEEGSNNEEAYAYQTTEIYAAAVIIHEIAFHAFRESADHFIKSDMFFDAVNSLQQYSKNVMKEDLAIEDAISSMLNSIEGMSNYDDLLTAANIEYGLTLTKEEVNRRSFNTNYKKVLTTISEIHEKNMLDYSLETEEQPLK